MGLSIIKDRAVTVQGVGMARNRLRNDPPKLAQLTSLSAESNNRRETLAEALSWESAWASVDPTWAPMPANTLTAFKALRNQCNEDLQTAYSGVRADWRKLSGKLAQMGRDLEDLNEAWYADATRAFPAGDMIRGTIPTTYTPPPPEAARPACEAAVVSTGAFAGSCSIVSHHHAKTLSLVHEE